MIHRLSERDKEIGIILWKLKKLWFAKPGLRFGQLLHAYVFQQCTENCNKIFNQNDSITIKNLKQAIEELS